MSQSRYHVDFPDRVKRFDFETLEKSEDSIYAINLNLEFIYFNPQYVKFSKQNGFNGNILSKHPVGSSIHDVLKGGTVSQFYLSNYLKSYEEEKPWSHEYQCSSTTMFRQYHHKTYPMTAGECIIIINSLTRESPIRNVHSQVLRDEMYIQQDGYIHQCSNCRRTQQSQNPDKWEWIPEYIDKIEPKKVSFKLCPICYEYYWKFAPRNPGD